MKRGLAIALIATITVACGAPSDGSPSRGAPGASDAVASPTPLGTQDPIASAEPTPENQPAIEFGEIRTQVSIFVDPDDPESAFGRLQGGLRVYAVSTRDREWYLVEFPYSSSHTLPEYMFGWVPGDALHAVDISSSCPSFDPDITWLGGMSPAEQLTCFGHRPLHLRGYLEPVAAEGNPVYVGEPAWLANEAKYTLLGNTGSAAEGGQLLVHFPPGAQVPSTGFWYRLDGHFDDPAALTCTRTPTLDGFPSQAETGVVWCKQQFVLENWVRDPGP